MSRKKAAKRQPTPPKQRQGFGKAREGFRTFFAVFLAILAILGGWIAVRPIVKVEPYIRLSESKPFSERFKVTNDGNFDIYDLTFACGETDARTAAGSKMDHNLVSDTSNYKQRIDAANSVTIDCPFDMLVNMGNDRYVSADIEFMVTFRPALYPWHKTQSFRFEGLLDDRGVVRWVPKDSYQISAP